MNYIADMYPVLMIMLLLMGGVWTAAALWSIWCGLGSFRHRRKRLLLIPAGVLALLGIAGFFGAGLSSSGALDWLGSFEWPIGYTSGVIRMPDGKYVVPHAPSNRVQVYDADLRFLRGWRVHAGAKAFSLRRTSDGNIEIYAPNSRKHFVYDPAGRMLSRSSYDPAADPSLRRDPTDAMMMWIPTHWWLLPVTGPFYAWMAVMVSGIVFALIERGSGKQDKSASNVRPEQSAQ